MARGPLAGVAGPGKYSVRTDGLSLPSAGYGEGVQTQQIMQGAPLAKTPDVQGAQAAQVRAAAQAPITPLFAPTERPNEPITQGIAMGPGAGPEVLGINQQVTDTPQDNQRLLSYLPALEAIAQSPSSSSAFRNYVRILRANLL